MSTSPLVVLSTLVCKIASYLHELEYTEPMQSAVIEICDWIMIIMHHTFHFVLCPQTVEILFHIMSPDLDVQNAEGFLDGQ